MSDLGISKTTAPATTATQSANQTTAPTKLTDAAQTADPAAKLDRLGIKDSFDEYVRTDPSAITQVKR